MMGVLIIISIISTAILTVAAILEIIQDNRDEWISPQAADYPLFDEAMRATFTPRSYPEYRWEGLPVQTDDGYLLTLFHVWKEGHMDSSQSPVMFQHGANNYAAKYL